VFDKNSNQQALSWAKKIMALRTLGGKCLCGCSNPLLLDFHHSNKDKECSINSIRNMRWSTFIKEAEKCTILCANCHGEVHSKECTNTDNRKRVMKEKLLCVKGQKECTNCGYSKSCSLDFHHVDEKNFSLSSYIFDRLKIPWETVLIEIDKCSVLCRNCHRINHYEQNFLELDKLIQKKLIGYKEKQRPANKEEVFRQLSLGVPQIQIARNLGYSKSTICQIIKRNANHFDGP